MVAGKSLKGRDSGQNFLLQAKLRAPIHSRQLVERPQLKSWVQTAEHARLVLVRAPAGFGKSTLMSQWLECLQEQGVKTAWLSLDESDNDPDRFISYLFAAIAKAVPELNLTLLGPSTWGSEGSLVAGSHYLLDQLAVIEGRFTLFLDDFGKIQNPLILEMVQQLLNHLPSQKNIVMGTRRRPEVGIGKIRARGELIDIDVECLRFSSEQTAQFVWQVRGEELDDNALGVLQDLTEGWVAGLQFSTLSGRGLGASERHAGIAVGSFHQLGEYLVEDVLVHQAEDIQNFLQQTSILNRFNSSLCDALTGRTDSNQILEHLEKANLFLIPLDDDRRWYRYHSLFAKFLCGRLEQNQGERLAELHLIASDWYEQQGEYQEAAVQALAAGNLERPAELMEQCAVDLIRAGFLGDVLVVAEQLPAAVLDRHPKLLLAYVYALTLRRHYERAIDVLDRARPETVDYSGFQNDVRLIKAVILFVQDQTSACNALITDQFLEDCKERKPLAYGTLLSLVGFLKVMAGSYDESLEYFGQAHLYLQKAKDLQAEVFNKYYEVTRELFLGRLQAAAALCRATLKSVGTGPLCYSLGSAAVAVTLAEILYETDELEEAETLLVKYNSFLRLLIPVDVIIIGFRTLSRLHAAKGNFSGALSCLAEIERLGAESELPRVVATARLEQARLALLRGDLGRAESLFQSGSDEKTWQDFEEWSMVGNDPETVELNRLRLMIELGQGEQALEMLRVELSRLEGQSCFRQELLARILMAKAYHSCGDKGRAQRVLKKALLSAQDEGYIRIFVDEGATLGVLVGELSRSTPAGSDKLSSEYLGRIMQAMAASGHAMSCLDGSHFEELVEPLTEREIKILELVAHGLSNEDLGDRLYISKHTVRSHLRNIHSKLGAKNRTEAVSLARRYGFVK